ncbi:hypothetical protein B0T14DRAFT_528418 [Immersiella caudata]|uniref:Uncharacterized protein n=1 Tax=Immersiella caudata TaxID=314043 RepID=A0AA39WFE7_9PEZI|nr:hypothetical protein B0T14DRAFT_528418 [Immersiella caudata]
MLRFRSTLERTPRPNERCRLARTRPGLSPLRNFANARQWERGALSDMLRISPMAPVHHAPLRLPTGGFLSRSSASTRPSVEPLPPMPPGLAKHHPHARCRRRPLSAWHRCVSHSPRQSSLRHRHHPHHACQHCIQRSTRPSPPSSPTNLAPEPSSRIHHPPFHQRTRSHIRRPKQPHPYPPPRHPDPPHRPSPLRHNPLPRPPSQPPPNPQNQYLPRVRQTHIPIPPPRPRLLHPLRLPPHLHPPRHRTHLQARIPLPLR